MIETEDLCRRVASALARAEAAAGAHGLFLEPHRGPDRARSDGPHLIPLNTVPQLLEQLLRLCESLS